MSIIQNTSAYFTRFDREKEVSKILKQNILQLEHLNKIEIIILLPFLIPYFSLGKLDET